MAVRFDQIPDPRLACAVQAALTMCFNHAYHVLLHFCTVAEHFALCPHCYLLQPGHQRKRLPLCHRCASSNRAASLERAQLVDRDSAGALQRTRVVILYIGLAILLLRQTPARRHTCEVHAALLVTRG